MAINDNNFKQNCGGSSTITTTSLVPQVYQGAGYVDAQANLVPNVADIILLSDGTRMEAGKVTWTGHGLTVGAYYWLDQAAPGGYTAVEPTSGLVQQLFFVEDADTIHIDVEHAHDVSAVAAGGHTTTLATCPATGPTVAPTTEGHYFWTSAIGENWQWIYGDAAPFVVGKYYGAFTPCVGGVAIPVNSFTNIGQLVMPRAGVVVVAATAMYSIGSGWESRYCDIFKNGVIETSNTEETRQAPSLGAASAAVVASASKARIVVAAGDLISMGAQIYQNVGSSAAGTSIASTYRGLSVQYVA